MAASQPIAASTPEGSNYGAIGISYNESIMEKFPNSPENRTPRVVQSLIPVRVGKAVIT